MSLENNKATNHKYIIYGKLESTKKRKCSGFKSLTKMNGAFLLTIGHKTIPNNETYNYNLTEL